MGLYIFFLPFKCKVEYIELCCFQGKGGEKPLTYFTYEVFLIVSHNVYINVS